MELELMKRVIVEVKSEADGIKLNFHPKLRKTPLQFLTIQIEALPVVNDSKYQVIPLIKYTYDLEEGTRGENEVDVQLRCRLRTLLLYDLLYKMR